MGGVVNLSPSYSLIVGSAKDHMLEILSLLALMFYRRKAELTVPKDVAGERPRIIKWKLVLISEFVSTSATDSSSLRRSAPSESRFLFGGFTSASSDTYI